MSRRGNPGTQIRKADDPPWHQKDHKLHLIGRARVKRYGGPFDSPLLLIIPCHNSFAFAGNKTSVHGFWNLACPVDVQYTASHMTASQSSDPFPAASIRLTAVGGRVVGRKQSLLVDQS